MNFLSMCFYGFFLTRFSIRFVCSCELPFLCVFVSCFAVHIEITTICCVKTKQKKERERETKYISQLPVATWLFFFLSFCLKWASRKNRVRGRWGWFIQSNWHQDKRGVVASCQQIEILYNDGKGWLPVHYVGQDMLRPHAAYVVMLLTRWFG